MHNVSNNALSTIMKIPLAKHAANVILHALIALKVYLIIALNVMRILCYLKINV